MCYDVSYKAEGKKSLRDYFPELIDPTQLELSFPSTDHIIGHAYAVHPVIYRDPKTQELLCQPMEWGAIPFYVKDEKIFLRQRASMLNARSERILGDEKSYWFKIRNRRCLVPVTGVYEHRAIKGWKKKVPYLIWLKDQPVFFLPALYSVVELPDLETGELVKRYTFALITREANSVMVNIHNDGENRSRMPLFLSTVASHQWLDADLSPEIYKQILDFEMPAENLGYHPVYTIRSAKERPDGKAKDACWEWEKLPALGELNPA